MDHPLFGIAGELGKPLLAGLLMYAAFVLIGIVVGLGGWLLIWLLTVLW